MIAIFDELDCPDLVDRILELGHALAVAGHAKSELPARGPRGAERMAREGEIRILTAGTAAEMEVLKEGCPTRAVEEKLAHGAAGGNCSCRAPAVSLHGGQIAAPVP